MKIKIESEGIDDYPIDVTEVTFTEDTSFNIDLHGIKYTINGHFTININNDGDVDLLSELDDLIVCYDNTDYRYGDFYQEYDNLTNGYKNYKQLNPLIENIIKKSYIA